MKKEEIKVIKKFLAHFPVYHAIPRANEALVIRKIKFLPPVLDLGCGDGKFALFTFGQKKIEVGLDQNKKEINKAKKSQVYQKVVLAEADKMPFADENFGSVISNSVIEHVVNLDQVLKEAARVLKKRGFFVLTVPTPLLSEYQFWSRFIPGYAEFKRKLWRHINYFGEKEWRRQLTKAGFKVVEVKKTNSKPAILWADLFFPFLFLGPLENLFLFLKKRRVFGFNKKGATLVVIAKKK